MCATPTSVTARRQLLPPLGPTTLPLKRLFAASCALSLTQKRVAVLCSARQERCPAGGSRFNRGAKETPTTTVSRVPPLPDDISTKMLTYCELPSTVHRGTRQVRGGAAVWAWPGRAHIKADLPLVPTRARRLPPPPRLSPARGGTRRTERLRRCAQSCCSTPLRVRSSVQPDQAAHQYTARRGHAE